MLPIATGAAASGRPIGEQTREAMRAFVDDNPFTIRMFGAGGLMEEPTYLGVPIREVDHL